MKERLRRPEYNCTVSTEVSHHDTDGKATMVASHKCTVSKGVPHNDIDGKRFILVVTPDTDGREAYTNAAFT